jgi:hypothetical protein
MHLCIDFSDNYFNGLAKYDGHEYISHVNRTVFVRPKITQIHTAHFLALEHAL